MDAPGDAKVEIINHTLAYLKLSGISIPESLGGIYLNGSPLNQDTKDHRNDFINAKNAAAAEEDNHNQVIGEGLLIPGVAAFTEVSPTITNLPSNTPASDRPVDPRRERFCRRQPAQREQHSLA